MQQQDVTCCLGVKAQTKYQILITNRKLQDSPESLCRQILIVLLRDLTPSSSTKSVKADLIPLLTFEGKLLCGQTFTLTFMVLQWARAKYVALTDFLAGKGPVK